MGLKIFGPGGIDQKSNDLLRDPKKLRDALNIDLNTHQEYVKRFGSDVDITLNGIYSSYPIIPSDPYSKIKSDFTFLKSLDGYFYFDGLTYKFRKNGTNITTRSEVLGVFPNVDTGFIEYSNISGAEYLNTFVFTHQVNQKFTMVFDGYGTYKAGLPTPNISAFVGTGTGFLLVFFDFIDMAGNTIYGPATIIPNAASSGTFVIDDLRSQGFWGDTLGVSLTSGSPITLDENNRTITPSGSGSFTNGGKFMIRSKSNGTTNPEIEVSDPGGTFTNADNFVILEIESFIAGTITFTKASFGGRSVRLSTSSSGTYYISYSARLRMFYSTSETTGYDEYGSPLEQPYITADLGTPTQNISYSFTLSNNTLLLSDFYDITTSKLRPPRCKYISTYGDQIICGNVKSFWNFDNKETLYTNNDLVMYSDISTGDIGFNFSEINRQLIGNTYDGQITGLVRSRDSMIIFKDNSVYALDGILIPGQYGLRKIETNEIGCLSDKSIIATDTSVIFQGQDGLYSINGYAAKKVTTELDPFFETVDQSLTRSVMYNKKDKYLFFTSAGIVVYDFNYDEWFIWSGITATKGLIVNNDRDIRMFNNESALKFIDDKNDSGTAINAWVKTAWFDLGEPSLLKKVTGLRYFSLNNAGQVLTSRLYHDWDESKVKADFTVDMSSTSTKTVLRQVDIQQAQSFSFFIGNNEIDEDMNLSGYEIVTGVVQQKDKNVK